MFFNRSGIESFVLFIWNHKTGFQGCRTHRLDYHARQSWGHEMQHRRGAESWQLETTTFARESAQRHSKFGDFCLKSFCAFKFIFFVVLVNDNGKTDEDRR